MYWFVDLKLVRTPLNVYFTAFKSIFLSLSMHLLPRMNVMLDFIWTLPVQLRGTRNKWTLQKILVHGRIRTTNAASLYFQRVLLTHSAIGAVDDMWLELLQYLFTPRYYKNSVPCAKGYTENENKIIANLQFGDWYHLNTWWLTQKKKFIMSYVSMTIYNIYSFLLFFFVYIVCIIICFLILYLCTG